MQDFDQRRNEYFNKLKSNVDVVQQVISDSNSGEKISKKGLEIFLMPKTEKELQFANLLFDLTLDSMSLFEDVINGNIKEIDLSHCEAINLYISIITALKNEDYSKIEKFKNSSIDMNNPKRRAKIIYELIVAFPSKYEEILERLLTETGFYINDEKSLLQFQIYLDEANKIIDDMAIKEFDIDDPDQIEFFSEFTEEFHKLYNCGIKNNQKKLKKKNLK